MSEKDDTTTPSTDSNVAGGGIFSTPDLTIETGNIPANVGGTPVMDETAAAPGSDNSSRIASAFANTDATSQFQNTNVAMQAGSNSTTSTATGDIKLTPSAKRKSKAPLIIIALLVLAGVGALVWGVTTGRLGSGEGTLRPRDSYYNLLVYGVEDPTEEEKSEHGDDWFIFTLSKTSLGEVETQEYKELLLEKLKAYIAEAAEPNDLSQYLQNISIAVNLFTYRELGNTLFNVYINQGQKSSLEYIKNITDYSTENRRIEMANKAISDYLYSQLDLFAIYQQMGCISNEAIVQSCVSEHYDEYYESYEDVFDTEEMILMAISSWQSDVEDIVIQQTNEALKIGGV